METTSHRSSGGAFNSGSGDVILLTVLDRPQPEHEPANYLRREIP